MKVRLFRNKADLPTNSFAQGVCAKAHPFSSCLAFDDETGSVKRNSLEISPSIRAISRDDIPTIFSCDIFRILID